MTREGLSDFITAAEHSLSLRIELSKASNLEEIIIIAKRYGFFFKHSDLENEIILDKSMNFFKKSKISSIKKLS